MSTLSIDKKIKDPSHYTVTLCDEKKWGEEKKLQIPNVSDDLVNNAISIIAHKCRDSYHQQAMVYSYICREDLGLMFLEHHDYLSGQSPSSSHRLYPEEGDVAGDSDSQGRIWVAALRNQYGCGSHCSYGLLHLLQPISPPFKLFNVLGRFRNDLHPRSLTKNQKPKAQK